jgi:ribonuclease BN (tRNA processing enzyme)
VVVGCGTVVPEADRACSAYWVEGGEVRALLDCGPGAVQALARLRLPWAGLTDLVISHFHADHVGAIPGLLFSLKHGVWPDPRTEPLRVWGPPGTRRLFEGLADALGEFVLDPGFQVEIREDPPGAERLLGDGLRLRSVATPHTPESRALRIERGGVSLAYTGDTGPEDALAEHFAGVDLLVCECSLPDEMAIDTHLSPTSVARLAERARPRLLLLTHVYPQFRAAFDVPALVRAAGWGGRLDMAAEGWSWNAPPA